MKLMPLVLALVLVCSFSPTSSAFDLGKILDVAKDVTETAQTLTINDQSEMQYGAQIHPGLVAGMGGQSSNATLRAYVNQVGQKLARHKERKAIVYHFTVIQSPVINAFALPGGYVYVTTGILSKMKDEAELAAVLGHEIGHVELKHGVTRLKTALLTEKGLKYGAAKMDSAVARNITNIFINLAQSGYGRAQELASDKYGVITANKSSYDPRGAIRVFEMLMAQSSGRASIPNKIFASHPEGKKRIAQAEKIIAGLAHKGSQTNKAGYGAKTGGL